MTRDEQRLAWRAYMTALLSASDFRDYAVDRMAVVADFLLKAEQQRFDAPDHSGDANKMVEPPEPRPWVGLTDEDVSILASWLFEDGRANVELLLRRADDLLREKNGGTR